MDEGDILSQQKIDISPDETAGELETRLALEGAKLLMETIQNIEGLKPWPQDHSQATYAPRLSKEDGRINWQSGAFRLERQVRAFQPWPGCYTRWQGNLLKIMEGVPLPEIEGVEIGQVVAGDMISGFGVGTGKGVLQVIKVQLEGKRPVSAEEFLCGQRQFIGALLPS